jgi:hypothetical protein
MSLKQSNMSSLILEDNPVSGLNVDFDQLILILTGKII